MNAFAAQLMHDMSNWTSSVINSFTSNNNNNENKDNDNESKSDSKIISQIMTGAIDENMFKRLMHPDHRYAAKLWSQLCHKIDISYPPKQSLQPIDIKNKANIKLINEIKYCMRHAFTAYQPAFVAMKSEEVSLAFKTPKSLLKTCFNISNNDIIIDNCSLKLDNWKSKTHQPSFYLIIDHNKNKIVLSIRGTSSLADVITDLNATSKKCDNNLFGINGSVHEGMWQSALFIKKKISLQLKNLCTLYPNYNCVFTGHSLGAGVAALLGLMYKNDPIIYHKNGLKVYAFASPCIVSKNLSECNAVNEYITSIALSTDVVTRLSWESMRKCNLRQDFIMKHSKEMISECMKCENMNDESTWSEFLRVLKDLKSPQPDNELYPLGKVLWFVPKVVMNDDIEYRRNYLMNFKNMYVSDMKVNDNNEQLGQGEYDNVFDELEGKDDIKMDDMEIKDDNNNNNNVKNKSKLNEIFNLTLENMSNGMKDFKGSIMSFDTYDGRIDSSMSQLWNEFYYDLSRGINDIKTDIRCKLDKTKRNKKYSNENYILCDASSCKYIFQELVFDLPESINAHEPQRYLWAFDATLRLQ